MSAAVAQHFPAECRITQPVGGFVLWVEMPEGFDAVRLFAAARGEGIAISPGSMFSTTERYANCIRINCGYPCTPEIDRAVARLGALVREMAEAVI